MYSLREARSRERKESDHESLQFTMDPQSTDESQQRPIEADINEYKRFVTLHSCKENQQTEHFAVVSKVVGIERLRNYHDDLEEILKLKSPDTNQEDVISQWVKFFQGYKSSFTRLKNVLNLTDADHENQIKQLVELAHFIRFPTVKEPSGMSQEEMLTKIQSTKESRKSQEELTEFKRFKKLHVYPEEADKKFISIVEAAGVARLRKYHEDLEMCIESLEVGCQSSFRVYFKRFYQGASDSLRELKENVGLKDEDEVLENQIDKLTQLAYFKRFPTRQDSGMLPHQMLLALGPTNSPPKTAIDTVERLAWSANIVREGFEVPYVAYDSIVTPALETLRDYIVKWESNLYRAPYTSIVGPTMSGKTRLILELAKHIPVVYICLRPPNSTGQPPRSELADLMLPGRALQVDLKKRYTRLLHAIFRVVASFFSKPKRQHQAIQDQLNAWNKYSLQLNDAPVPFARDVQKEMEMLAHSPVKTTALQDAARKMYQSIPGQKEWLHCYWP
ncbi:hypothetical protein, variant 1 [Puccinia triticina 1-1 BBBD Race 1]|uniref:Uncharacterized protein n=1 Tax=Puccinia triticina (isolate 1-1 / race 1 (BBBD)) TaxID=630390 RepID=A0A180GAG3_PUCT1|nr:hypothetical protein, variant 1 [Puccinia triticina 1-1 BBBD Race 1]